MSNTKDKEYTSSRELLKDTEQKAYWREVAKEFHFDKPFHESVVQAISERLMEKFELISKRDKEWSLKWYEMQANIEKEMESWDIEARKRAAQAIKDLSELIITV